MVILFKKVFFSSNHHTTREKISSSCKIAVRKANHCFGEIRISFVQTCNSCQIVVCCPNLQHRPDLIHNPSTYTSFILYQNFCPPKNIRMFLRTVHEPSQFGRALNRLFFLFVVFGWFGLIKIFFLRIFMILYFLSNRYCHVYLIKNIHTY